MGNCCCSEKIFFNLNVIYHGMTLLATDVATEEQKRKIKNKIQMKHHKLKRIIGS